MTAKGGNYQEKPLKGNYWIFQGNCKQGNFSFYPLAAAFED